VNYPHDAEDARNVVDDIVARGGKAFGFLEAFFERSLCLCATNLCRLAPPS